MANAADGSQMSALSSLMRPLTDFVETLGAVTTLTGQSIYWAVMGPIRRKTKFRRFLLPLMHQIGVKSFTIVALTAFLVGAILVLQTADQFEKFGSKSFVPNVVAIALIRELGPLMTAIVLAGRVGAAFTAGLGSMVINDEVLALRTMGINPVGFLVAPRFIAIVIMQPCLTAYSYILGILGGLTVGTSIYQIPFWQYVRATINQLNWTDLGAGLVKGAIFGTIICMVSCHYAFTVRGGPEGVGRNTMVSVVRSLITIIIADALINALLAKYAY